MIRKPTATNLPIRSGSSLPVRRRQRPVEHGIATMAKSCGPAVTKHPARCRCPRSADCRRCIQSIATRCRTIRSPAGTYPGCRWPPPCIAGKRDVRQLSHRGDEALVAAGAAAARQHQHLPGVLPRTARVERARRRRPEVTVRRAVAESHGAEHDGGAGEAPGDFEGECIVAARVHRHVENDRRRSETSQARHRSRPNECCWLPSCQNADLRHTVQHAVTPALFWPASSRRGQLHRRRDRSVPVHERLGIVGRHRSSPGDRESPHAGREDARASRG